MNTKRCENCRVTNDLVAKVCKNCGNPFLIPGSVTNVVKKMEEDGDLPRYLKPLVKTKNPERRKENE